MSAAGEAKAGTARRRAIARARHATARPSGHDKEGA
jgi:hypothetical protein